LKQGVAGQEKILNRNIYFLNNTSTEKGSAFPQDRQKKRSEVLLAILNHLIWKQTSPTDH
jgi:hypothetical protein